MLRYTYLKDLLQAHWMLEPWTAAAHQAIFRGVLMGLQMEKDDSPIQYNHDIDDNDGDESVEKNTHKRCINVVNLDGVMTKEDGECHYGTKSIAQILLDNDNKENVIGHVLKINSGGGAANSVSVLADAIQRLTKPIVAFVDGMMCSAAMYAGSYCPYIIANSEDDRIGCIGTMIEIMDYPKKANLPDGMITLRIYASESTEKNLEYEAALDGNIELIRKNMLDPVNEKFLNAIRTNRKKSTEEQLKGRTYFAKETVGTLIDEIGDIEAAFAKVRELAKISEDSKTTNQHNTMKFDKINQIESCASVETQDGSATLSEAQLTDIELNLAEAVSEIERKESELQKAQESITTLTNSVAQKEARIKELEQIINDADDGVENLHHNGTQENQEADDIDKAREACREFIKQFNS